MKSLYFTLVFISLAISTQAQKINFTDTSNIWIIATSSVNPGQILRHTTAYEKYYYNGDTTINGIIYYEMRCYVPSTKTDHFSTFVRYDSIDNKVYIFYQYTDIVLYDYNLKIGDTFYAPFSYYYPDLYYTVTNVDSVLIKNVYHKQFQLQVTDSSFVDLWYTSHRYVEGIGCISAPLDHLSGERKLIYFAETSRGIMCFKNQGTYLSQNCSDDFVKEKLSVGQSMQTGKIIQLYPQPASSVVNIQLPAKILSGSLSVFNQLGQVVISSSIAYSELLEIHNPGNLHGLYYYRISDHTETKIYSGKILFE